MDLISIIVPVYKVEPYLDMCLDSLVCQTYRNLEIILVDDGSPDRCPAMCDAWAERDDRIRVIHKKNGGSSAARNAGLDIAQGEYIGFVDSDDMARPDMFEILLNAIRGSRKKIACCRDGWNPDAPYAADTPEPLEMGVEETVNCIFSGRVGTAVWRRLYHRSVWKTLRFPEGEVNEDYPLLIPTTVAAGGMVEVRAPLYYYRQTPNSITGTYWKNNAGIVLKNMERIHRQIEENQLNCLPQFRNFVIRAIYSGGIILDKNLQKLSEDGRKVHRQYLQLMRRLCFHAVFGKTLKMKDKILYFMVVTQVLRPVYRIMGRLSS